MRVQNVLCSLLIAGAIVMSASVTQAQSAGRNAWPRAAAVTNTLPASPDRAGESVPATEPVATSAKARKTAIAGSWQGSSGEGNRLLITYNADGTYRSNVQTEVSTIPELGVLSPGHGVWKHLGGQRFGLTGVGMLYDINTGVYLGYLKVRQIVTIDASGNELSGTDKVEIFAPDGSLVAGPFEGETHFTRIQFEPFE